MIKIMNTFVSDSFIDTIMGETESIISIVEDFLFENEVTNEGTTGLDDFEYIRFISEELQTKVLDFTCSVMNYDTLSEIEDISITLYQHIKYSILDLVETNTFVSDNEYFEYLCCSIDIIRYEIDTLVLQAKN